MRAKLISVALLFLIGYGNAFSSSPSESRRIRSRRTRSATTSSDGPKADSRRVQKRRQTSRERVVEEAFDPKRLTECQIPNEDAAPIDLFDGDMINDPNFLKRRSESSVVQITDKASVNVDEVKRSDINECKGFEIDHQHVEFISLDSLFPNLNFSEKFCNDGEFRQKIRETMRKDIFFTTPAYADMSAKVAALMLDDDSSLQGTWNCIPKNLPKEMQDSIPARMNRLTNVLQEYLGKDAPTGDALMMTLGGLCGENPTFHWIDIIGVKDRVVSHSWHQDSGKSYECGDTRDKCKYTVMFGFPIEDSYEGTGVFSHVIKLKNEHIAPPDHNVNEPVLFKGTTSDEYIVRAKFVKGREILRYKDVDVLHSAPDVVYRKSVMRFM